MSELCKYDEQVLDYLYGDLVGAERAAFADHLSGCPSCRRELDSLSGVRKEVAELPRPVLATDAAARMTAQLMEAAIAATKATAASPALGGGKLLQFPSGRIKRALTHPVSAGILVAAAALFIVVFRLREPAEPVSDSPVPAPAVLTPQAPAKAPSPAAAPADVPAQGRCACRCACQGRRACRCDDPSTDCHDGDRAKACGAGEECRCHGKRYRPKADDGATAEAGSGLGAGANDAIPMEKPMVERDRGDRVASNKLDAINDSRFAQPPPPLVAESTAAPAAPAVVAQQAPGQGHSPQAAPSQTRNGSVTDDESNQAGIVAQSKARQQKRNLEELERVGLAQGPVAAAADSDNYSRRAAQTGSLGRSGVAASAPTGGVYGGAKDSQSEEDAPSAAASQAPPADKQAEKGADRQSPLTLVYEQIRSGHCPEARELIQKLERSQPGLPGLAEANTTWQRDCGARLPTQNRDQLNILQQNYQNLQQSNLPPRSAYPAATPSPAPMPSPVGKAPMMDRAPLEREQQYNEARRTMAKKAAPPPTKAPAKAKAAAPAKAADVAF
jgi:hypothetical protein